MTTTFKIIADNQPAILERLLRVTRHRGFKVQSMDISLLDEQFVINLCVKSEKSLHLLTNQLQKLYDIKTIEVS